MNRTRTISALAGTLLAVALGVGPVAADHTYGVLDCGAAGTFEVEAASIEPLPKFEAPVPWAAAYLIEGTNRVFVATSISTPRWSIVLAGDRNPRATLDCSLTSSGFNFEQPWVLTGFLAP